MTHALELLKNELKRLQTANQNEEDDLIDAVINFRATSDVKLALKILNDFLENSKILKY